MLSIIQGVVITGGTLFVYSYSIVQLYDEQLTRTMVFTVLIFANVFLTLVNRSPYYSFITSMKYKNNAVPLIIFITLTLVAFNLYLKPLSVFFEFTALSSSQVLICFLIGSSSVLWFEVLKMIKRWRFKKHLPIPKQ
jgi:Ca2+-transporting ATPase